MNNENGIKYNSCFGILHYGDIRITIRCIESLLRLKHIEECLIIVYDNDLGSDIKTSLSEYFGSIPNIKVISDGKKHGFSVANNALYSYCKRYDFQFLGILNNDIEIYQKNFIDILIQKIQEDKYYIIGPDIYKKETDDHQSPLAIDYPGIKKIYDQLIKPSLLISSDIKTAMNAVIEKQRIEKAHRYLPRIFFTLYRSITQGKNYSVRYSKEHENAILSGAALFFTEKYLKVEDKAFYPVTEFYFEEMILGLKCKEKNYRTLYTPDLKVYHKHAVASLADAGSSLKYEQIVAKRMIESFEVLKKYEKEVLGKQDHVNEKNQVYSFDNRK